MHVTNHNDIQPGGSKNIVSFNQLWQRYISYWPMFILLLLLGAAAAKFYTWYTIPVYESNAKILINDEKKGAEGSKDREVFNTLNSKKIIENEMEVVQSRTLIDDVAKRLFLNVPVFKKEKFQLVSAYDRSPVNIETKDSVFQNDPKPIAFTVNNSRTQVTIGGKDYPLDKWVVTAYGNLKFSSNPALTKPIEANTVYYFKVVNPRVITSDIQDRLQVASASKLSSILMLSFKDQVPKRGEDFLNELLNAYNRAILLDRNMLAKNTLSFVNARLDDVSADLNSIEKKSQQYRSGKGAIDIGTQGRLYLENVSSNDQKLSEINMQLAVLDQVESYATSTKNTGAIVPSTLGINDAILSQLLNKLYETESDYEKLGTTEAANYPTAIALSDQIAKLKPAILQNIQSQRKSLLTSKANISATNDTYSKDLQTLPEKEKELIEINREKMVKYNNYAFLLQKREETALAYSSAIPENRLVDSAQSSLKPVSPNNKTVYAVCMLIALLLGISVITVKDTFGNKILYRQEIEALTSMPIIGEIIYEKSKKDFVTGDGKETFIAEQFRQLRVALQFIKKDIKKKKILVTSSISGEGKSFISLNLALTVALTGKRVALVELDLINASISDKFDEHDNLGVTDYLMGTATLEQVLVPTKVNENLFLISAGTSVKNSSELLTNGKIEVMLEELEKDFDYIVIDTEPVNLVTDAYILSPLCDITLYIIRHNYTANVFVQRIDDNNKINRLHNIALVFNGIKARGFGTKGYGFGYGYGYAYKEKRPRHIGAVETLKQKRQTLAG